MAVRCSSIRLRTARSGCCPPFATLPGTSSAWCNSSPADRGCDSAGQEDARTSEVAMPAHDALQLGADRANPLRSPVFRLREMDRQWDEPGCAASSTPHLTLVVRACHARYFASARLWHVNPRQPAD